MNSTLFTGQHLVMFHKPFLCSPQQIFLHRPGLVSKKQEATRFRHGFAFHSPRSPILSRSQEISPRCSSSDIINRRLHDTPPKRDTGIASEKDWGISFQELQSGKDYGISDDGSLWYKESQEELGDNGSRHRWVTMGGDSNGGSSTWEVTWWEKSDWSGYKELGAKRSGGNAKGDSWLEIWQETLYQYKWSCLARIEKSAEKHTISGEENDNNWSEKWWEKYDAKESTEKGALKFGKLCGDVWWEQWGEHYDGLGFVKKWINKWEEISDTERCGENWEAKFTDGIGSRHGESWRVSQNGERWSRFWGEDYFGDGKVHKYGGDTNEKTWEVSMGKDTSIETEPHHGWADVIADCAQLLSIEPQQKPQED